MSAMPEATLQIRRLQHLGNVEIQGLSDVLIDCVEGGAAVGFMLPISLSTAMMFWRKLAGSVHRGERILFAAYDAGGRIIGTVQLILQQPENQPHRADLTKMLVHRRARRQGIGGTLLATAERSACEAGKTLLVVDTTSATAGRLYARLGWQRCGTIPGYALRPDGRPCDTTLFFKSFSR